MRTTSLEKAESVVKLDGPARYKHFVKRVADEEVVWGLREDGLALMTDSDGRSVLPLWPARVYAEMCAVGEWSGYAPDEIPLDHLLDGLLPKMEAAGVSPGVFPTPHGKGVVLTASELAEALRSEAEQYE